MTGEDPHLTARLTVAWVTGAQNNTPFATLPSEGHLLSGLCCKHFAAYDIENRPTSRQTFDAKLSSRSMWETYMPAFEACIKEARATHVMCSCVFPRTRPGGDAVGRRPAHSPIHGETECGVE